LRPLPIEDKYRSIIALIAHLLQLWKVSTGGNNMIPSIERSKSAQPLSFNFKANFPLPSPSPAFANIIRQTLIDYFVERQLQRHLQNGETPTEQQKLEWRTEVSGYIRGGIYYISKDDVSKLADQLFAASLKYNKEIMSACRPTPCLLKYIPRDTFIVEPSEDGNQKNKNWHVGQDGLSYIEAGNGWRKYEDGSYKILSGDFIKALLKKYELAKAP
jgi:hypothetical protein